MFHSVSDYLVTDIRDRAAVSSSSVKISKKNAFMMSARKSMLGKRKNIPRPIRIQPPISTINDRLGTDMVRSARKSMLGKRKNIPQPIPVQPPVSTIKRHLGMASVKRPECVNLSYARRKLWPTSEELLIRNQNSKDKDCGPQKKKNISADACNILPTAVCTGSVGSRFESDFHTNDAKENVSVQCPQPITMQTPVSLNKVGTSCFGSRPSIPHAYIGLKSNTSQNVANVTNYLSAESVKFGKNSPACGSAITRPSQIPTLLKSKVPQKSTAFTSQLRTEPSELCKTFAVSNSEGTGISYMHEVLNCSKSKGNEDFKNNYKKSGFYEKSISDLVTGALDGSKYLMSQKLKSCVCHNESGESSKIMSHGGTSQMVSNKISTFAYGDTFPVSAATQTDLVVKNNTAIQTDSVTCTNSGREKLFALIEHVLKHQEQLGAMYKKQAYEMHALQNQTHIIHNEVVNILNVFSHTEEVEINRDIMFEETNNHTSDEKLGYRYNHKDSEECSRTPLRRSARIAAQTTCALAAGNKSLPSTPEYDGVAHYPSAKSIEICSTVKLNKSESVYKELCSSFRFLKTPQSTKRPLAKTPKATPNQLLKQRLKDQILSLYN